MYTDPARPPLLSPRVEVLGIIYQHTDAFRTRIRELKTFEELVQKNGLPCRHKRARKPKRRQKPEVSLCEMLTKGSSCIRAGKLFHEII